MELHYTNFLGDLPKKSSYEEAGFVVLPIPYDATTSFQPGTRNGPRAILAASEQTEDFDEELGHDCPGCRIATLAPLAPRVDGPEAMVAEIARVAKRVMRDGKFLLGLGGEHSVSGGLIQAAAARHRSLSVLQIDAHCDLRDSYEGSKYSHASVMRRALDAGAAIVPVGIRNISREEHAVIRRQRIPVFTARACHGSADWVQRVVDALGPTVYITIDIDGFDPAYAPGTGTPEPGGLDWYQVTGLLRAVIASRNVVAADIVEVLPIPGQSVTEFLAARLAYKLIAYQHTRQTRTLSHA